MALPLSSVFFASASSFLSFPLNQPLISSPKFLYTPYIPPRAPPTMPPSPGTIKFPIIAPVPISPTVERVLSVPLPSFQSPVVLPISFPIPASAAQPNFPPTLLILLMFSLHPTFEVVLPLVVAPVVVLVGLAPPLGLAPSPLPKPPPPSFLLKLAIRFLPSGVYLNKPPSNVPPTKTPPMVLPILDRKLPAGVE